MNDEAPTLDLGEPPNDEGPSFTKAMEQLEHILHRIESEEIDIDQLGVELKQATQLLELCRGKLKRAEVEVNQILETLE
jgi:exodeoxyribonuclease VII small subunit